MIKKTTSSFKEPSKEVKDYWRKQGNYFGYPKCCTEAFLNRDKTLSKLRRELNNGTGFTPCAKHASYIIKNGLELKDILVNRKEKLPFPQTDPLSNPYITDKQKCSIKVNMEIEDLIKQNINLKKHVLLGRKNRDLDSVMHLIKEDTKIPKILKLKYIVLIKKAREC